jgi:hypothetical protein
MQLKVFFVLYATYVVLFIMRCGRGATASRRTCVVSHSDTTRRLLTWLPRLFHRWRRRGSASRRLCRSNYGLWVNSLVSELGMSKSEAGQVRQASTSMR